MRIKILSPFVLSLLIFFACDVTEPTVPFRELSSAEEKLIEADNSFGFKLFKNLDAEMPDSNIFIAPLSVSMAFGMTYNGAAGETEEAMRTTLEFGDLSRNEINGSYKSLIELFGSLDENVKFNISNSIWHRDDWTFKQDFFNRCNDYFDARVTGLDFSKPEAAEDTINNWVSENTEGKIKEIVANVNPIDVMFLINAIYFNGNWTYQFNEEDTKDDIFHLPDGSTKECKMMEVKSKFKYFADSLVQVIDIPYGNGDFSMTVVLPGYGKDLNQLIAELTQEQWDNWINGLSEDSVNLFLPKFKLKFKVENVLKKVLTDMGMGIAFDGGGANFTEMYQPGGIWIGRIIHKTFLKVDETGTEAAAATAVVMVSGPDPDPQPVIMYINRPFLFSIRENQSGTIFFMGKIVEPFWG